jgi:hypothetical protein
VSVLDSVLQLGLGLSLGEQAGGAALLPFAVEDVRVFRAKPARGWACMQSETTGGRVSVRPKLAGTGRSRFFRYFRTCGVHISRPRLTAYLPALEGECFGGRRRAPWSAVTGGPSAGFRPRFIHTRPGACALAGSEEIP